MSIQSPCSITFIPLGGEPAILLEEGGWLIALPRFGPEQALFELDGVESGESWFKPLGGVVVAISFEVETQDENAHESFLSAEMLGVEGELVISGLAGTAVYSSAVIASITPGLPAGPDPTLTRAFTVRAALPEV